MKKNFLIKIILFLIAGFFAAPHFAEAESVFLYSNKESYNLGEYISVDVKIDTGENLVNAIQGTINFPEDSFEVESIKTGQSALTLWPQKPSLNGSGAITFAGGVPHGFKSTSGNVFSFILKSIKAGEYSLYINSTKVLLNDGLGTQLANVSLSPLKIIVAEKISSGEVQQLEQDQEKPLEFTPVVSQSLTPADKGYFVSFSTTDKESGVDHYEAREEYVLLPFWGTLFSTGWEKTETPYVLKLQHWWTKVYIRAYDSAGNFSEQVVTKDIDEDGLTILKVSSITLVTILFVVGSFILKFIPTVL